MEKFAARLRISFSTKVLVPVVTIMVLLLALMVWTLNPRITQQFQNEGERSRAPADAVFRSSRKMRQQDLLMRYHSLPNEPRFKAIFQKGDAPTIKLALQELLAEQSVDVIVYTMGKPESIATARRNPIIP